MRKHIKQQFKDFYSHFTYLEMEQALEYFAVFGGMQSYVDIDFFDDLDEIIMHNFVLKYSQFDALITPSYLLEAPYRTLLIAIARGDGKLLNIFRRARINETVGGELVAELSATGIVQIELSREHPLKRYPKQKIKKTLRSYRIQSKVRFMDPFLRFWFGFVEPYRHQIKDGKSHDFFQNFHLHYDRCVSLVFEQLSNELLELQFQVRDPLQSKGGYWDQYSEFDLLSLTKSGKIILGECKYKGRKICKNELTKLQEKALHSGIHVDYYALFSKNGFSNELLLSKDESVLLFDIESFKQLLV